MYLHTYTLEEGAGGCRARVRRSEDNLLKSALSFPVWVLGHELSLSGLVATIIVIFICSTMDTEAQILLSLVRTHLAETCTRTDSKLELWSGCPAQEKCTL